MWLPANVAASKCGCQQMWLPANVAASKCGCQQMWLPANWGSNIESLNGADFGD
jgi:hypothetical protein